MRLINLVLVPLLLTACVYTDEGARKHASHADHQRWQEEAYRNALSDRCRRSGFQPGTDAFANCMAQQHRAFEQRTEGPTCQRAQQDAQYWCGGPAGFDGHKCQQARHEIVELCWK